MSTPVVLITGALTGPGMPKPDFSSSDIRRAMITTYTCQKGTDYD
jgi:hypothetical protein